MYSLSGDAAPDERWRPVIDPEAPRPASPAQPKRPAWLAEQDLHFLTGAFRRSSFSGGLNYCRNMDRNWAITCSSEAVTTRS